MGVKRHKLRNYEHKQRSGWGFAHWHKTLPRGRVFTWGFVVHCNVLEYILFWQIFNCFCFLKEDSRFTLLNIYVHCTCTYTYNENYTCTLTMHITLAMKAIYAHYTYTHNESYTCTLHIQWNLYMHIHIQWKLYMCITHAHTHTMKAKHVHYTYTYTLNESCTLKGLSPLTQ